MQNKKIKIFIIAGEVSGDALAARVMRRMASCAEFVGIGGAAMTKCGLKSIFPMADLSVMGIMEVLAHARTLTRRVNQTVDAIIATRPDLVLTVDSPGFAKAVIKKLRASRAGQKMIESGLRFHHIVAPQVWAWRPGRAERYAQTFDKLYAFFDFEVPYFTKYGLPTIAVGHPIAENIMDLPRAKQMDDKIITLVPGSRLSEVKKLMPIFRRFVETINSCGYMGYKFAIPIVETTADYVMRETKDWVVKPELVAADARYDLYQRTYVAVAASGTVSAELAMMHVPAIITYKMNRITTLVGRILINVRWVSLVNILLNRSVYPEFLGGDATAENIINEFDTIILPANRAKMIKDLSAADNMWVRPEGVASKIIADDIVKSVYPSSPLR
ncbi:MAG: lipid-A-disaccharide synthase [Alphaproteobacteria bacterium]|nr:lipid-A-disaccharide synthase [Alphaproteobacteria bacterium]